MFEPLITVQKRLTGFSCAHRMWTADSHCRFVHGYDRAFTFTIDAEEPDANGFIFDFGNFGPIKAALAEQFDHTLCIAANDPQRQMFETFDGKMWQLRVMDHPGMEGAAEWCLDRVGELVSNLTDGRARLVSVKVEENDRNSVTASI